jgi:hypothetical protein
VLLLALFVARACGSTGDEISQDEAVEIAKRQIDYRAELTQVRFLRRGVPKTRAYWAVSLSTLDERGRPERVTVVVVDARTKAVAEVRRRGG